MKKSHLNKTTALSRFQERAVVARRRFSEWRMAFRPFFLAFFITLALSGLLAGWTAVGVRCRLAADPPETETALFIARDGYLKVRLLDFSADLKIEVIPLRGPASPASP